MLSGSVFMEAPKVRLLLRLHCTALNSNSLGAQQGVNVSQTASLNSKRP